MMGNGKCIKKIDSVETLIKRCERLKKEWNGCTGKNNEQKR